MTASETIVDGTSYVADGVTSFDDTNNVTATWTVADVIDPTDHGISTPGYWMGSPLSGAVDWSHANSIDIGPTGNWLVSFKHLSTILSIYGDPAAANFGEIEWALSPAGAQISSDFEITSSSSLTEDHTFTNQHAAHWTEHDTLLLFDNGAFLPPQEARVIEMDLDVSAGVADIIGVWNLGTSCPIQSSGFHTATGNLLAACTNNAALFEFPSDGGEPIWEARVDCIHQTMGPMGDGLMVRALPIAL